MSVALMCVWCALIYHAPYMHMSVHGSAVILTVYCHSGIQGVVSMYTLYALSGLPLRQSGVCDIFCHVRTRGGGYPPRVYLEGGGKWLHTVCTHHKGGSSHKPPRNNPTPPILRTPLVYNNLQHHPKNNLKIPENVTLYRYNT